MGKKREKKVSKGIHGGGGKTTLTELQKVLISRTHVPRIGAARAKRVEKAAS